MKATKEIFQGAGKILDDLLSVDTKPLRFTPDELARQQGYGDIMYRGMDRRYDPSKAGDITWMSKEKEFAHMYADSPGNIMELRTKANKPYFSGYDTDTEAVSKSDFFAKMKENALYDYEDNIINKGQLDAINNKIEKVDKGTNTQKVWEWQNDPEVIDTLKTAGYDSIRNFEGIGNIETFGVFDTKNIKILKLAKKYGIAPGAVTAAMVAQEDEAQAAEQLQATNYQIPKQTQLGIGARPESQAIGVPEGWRSIVHDTGLFLQQELPTPLGGTWFEGLGDYMTDLSEGQKKDLLDKYTSGLWATLDVIP